MTIEENVPLAQFTTFRIGGFARFFVRVEDVTEIEEVFSWIDTNNVQYKVLGGGSNVLVSDQGFDGLIIKMENKGIRVEKSSENLDEYFVHAAAGENWDELVSYTVRQGLCGLENLSLIPGSVGASVVQNIGAYGVEVKDCIHQVEFYAPDRTYGAYRVGEFDFGFGYRDSIFKHGEWRDAIITSVAFKLKKNSATNISYKDLKNYFSEKNIEPTLQNVRNAVIEIRNKKLPDVTKIGSAGSFFKNPIITQTQFEILAQKYPGLVSFPAGEGFVKVSAAWILDNMCGFKGIKRGHVGVYQNQALVLVNWGGGTSEDILHLAQEMIDAVKEKTGIILSPEVETIGK